MAGYCTLVLYFHSPAARENTAAHSCNIQPYYLLTHQILYIYMLCTCPDSNFEAASFCATRMRCSNPLITISVGVSRLQKIEAVSLEVL